MSEEYESSFPVRFLNLENVKMYDSEGNVMLCKCGKPAGAGIMGKEAFQVWCSDCSPLPKTEFQFVYRPPKE